LAQLNRQQAGFNIFSANFNSQRENVGGFLCVVLGGSRRNAGR